MSRSPCSRRLLIASNLAVFLTLAPLPAWAQPCVRQGAWIAPQGARWQELGWRELTERAAKRTVVLLGEMHDQAEHQRWQLHTMAALHARRSDIVLGFEMFPRRVQRVLDRWVEGELSESAFLEQVDWPRAWGFAPAHYLPLFHFARMHRIPMIALNVERELVREIARKGVAAVPEAMREGVGMPEPASADYLRELHAVYRQHGHPNRTVSMDDPGFKRFVDGQLTWDRAMAEAIRDARVRYPDRQVVAALGRGHTGPGAVPHQLRALGLPDAMVLLPWENDAQCSRPTTGAADAVFGIAAQKASESQTQRPRLGVTLEGDAEGVRIRQVSGGSIGADAGLQAGDVVIAIAGRAVRRSADVTAVVTQQPPGTWLPIRVRRAQSEVELVAKFPPPPR